MYVMLHRQIFSCAFVKTNHKCPVKKVNIQCGIVCNVLSEAGADLFFFF